MLYLPGERRSAGKLKLPLSSLTTDTVMVEPSFLALTTTPSMLPSSAEDTTPVSAEAPCASAPVGRPASRKPQVLTLASSQRFLMRIIISQDFVCGEQKEKSRCGPNPRA